MAYFIMSETIKELSSDVETSNSPTVQQVVVLWGMTLLNLPLNLTWVISWIFLKIQILVRLFIQKGREIRKSTIHCVHYLSFRWLRAYS